MDECTCTYGAYALYAGGTGWDVAHYDPECPEHGEDELDIIECPGHPAGPFDPMGQTVYCDGTCQS